MRVLSSAFIQDLLDGKLSAFLRHVQQDDTLCLEIRQDYINIYYRGGSLFRIAPAGAEYSVSFDMNYASARADLLKHIPPSDYAQWVNAIPLLKAEMDAWFYRHAKSEREYQQIVLRENNHGGISADTDYYMADIEYANTENESRFDLIGIKWPSTSMSRKRADDIRLAFFEMKYGDGAHAGVAGIVKHFEDLYRFVTDSQKLETVRIEAESQINQKVQLGLIPSITKVVHISHAKPEFILLMANHKPVKSAMHRELQRVVDWPCYGDLCAHVDIKLATASFLGYGLYEACMKDLEEVLQDACVKNPGAVPHED